MPDFTRRRLGQASFGVAGLAAAVAGEDLAEGTTSFRERREADCKGR